MKKAEQLFEQYLKEKGITDLPSGMQKDEIVEYTEWVLENPEPKLELKYSVGQMVEVVCDPDEEYEAGDIVEISVMDYYDKEFPYGVESSKCSHLWWFAEHNLKPIS